MKDLLASLATLLSAFLNPVSDAENPTQTQACGRATIQLTQPWSPAKELKYVASFGDFTPDFEVEPDEQWEQLGEHRTSAILEFGTEVETQCDTNTCRTCVTAITALIGFTPSEIRVHEDLRRNHCARKITRRHEEEHQAITRRAQKRVLEDARFHLAWATRNNHAPYTTPAESTTRRRGRDHAQGRGGPDARITESRGLFGQVGRSPGSTGAIPARESRAVEKLPAAPRSAGPSSRPCA